MTAIIPSQDFAAASGQGGFADRLTRIGAQLREPAMKRLLPWFVSIGGLGLAALTWALLAPAPQRVLYTSLDDSERASVVSALDQAGIGYNINNDSGALSVGEDDLYRARMVVASNGALAAPADGSALLNSLPMGASRNLEGDRLRAARERDLELTIAQIDGVRAVRVHLAQAERSVFVREDLPPSASVMVTLARGRQLSESQVSAIANLVAASVPGLSLDAVRIVDQHGSLLTQPSSEGADRLAYQAEMEAKLRSQLSQVLTPMFGEGNFSSEVQVNLDMDELTSARESYDKDGSLRSEIASQSTAAQRQPAGGIPGATTNLAPAAAQAQERAPQGGPQAGQAANQPSGQSQTSRKWDFGREVAVTNKQPGDVRQLSVAVAIDQAALKGAKPADIAKIEALVGATVGANPARGDKVTVLVRPFEKADVVAPNFWEESWFATVLRNVVALLGVILVLLFGVRPMVKAVRDRKLANADGSDGEGDDSEAGVGSDAARTTDRPSIPQGEDLTEQVELARRISREQPGDALNALRALLENNSAKEAAE
ncbi:flagellar M-ring protein FliF [Porphyrobacter algicida]|uniref:Flagellar M-ring protein n=1 Tax=Qipengyuania algicida TaxID=1836209 RepID=A0A845AEK5_9SPHN|nr:flagellar basal-body MS-ring/collar protein FliF [Qipengyuania algicida]MXP27653.1 flagellar M-ring protein FliF [Qipengyuania algicida]